MEVLSLILLLASFAAAAPPLSPRDLAMPRHMALEQFDDSNPTTTPQSFEVFSERRFRARKRDASPSSPACSVASSAPSIAPYRLTSPDGADVSPNATISQDNSTLFEYTIPKDFVTAPTALCGLQFRLPTCFSLSKGYPCFSFSGSEQEQLSHSGMTFNLTEGTIAWNNTAVHQIFPGDNTVFGTFECGSAWAYGGAKNISWLVSSANGFGLDFMQGGMHPKFPDGVGAWVVACS